jgi:hypothetical protein
MTRHVLTLLAFAAVAGCSAATSPTDPSARPTTSTTGSASLNDTLSIPVGQSRFADGGKLELRFDARVADSRCPANAVCVWAGDAHVRLSTRVTGGAFKTAELHSGLEPRKLVVDGYSLTMVGMTPYPGTGQDSSSPTLIIAVSRN